MHSGPEGLGASVSFSTRRPNTSSLPNFELPPPPLSIQPHHNHNKYSYGPVSQPSQPPTTIASVGNLLTPPSNMPGEGMNPASSGVTTGGTNSTHGVPQYAPNGYVWSPSSQHPASYGFHSGAGQQSYGHQAPPRGLPPPPYDNMPPYPPSSAAMSPPTSLPQSMGGQQQSLMMNPQTPVSSSAPQPSPIHAQETYHQSHRQPPTPTGYYGHHSSTPQHQQGYHPYSTGPSPTHHSPLSAGPMSAGPMSAGGPMSRVSPVASQGQVPQLPSAPPQSPHPYQRPYNQYPLPGPVLSNMSHPNGPLVLTGGVHNGMMQPFNSGHAANLQHHLYSPHHPPQQSTTQDRPFKCDQCPQSFNRNHDLKRHKRIHLAVKPFPCGHCDKSFSRKDALKRHILVKGCGKPGSGADGDKQDGSISPNDKSKLDDKSSISRV